MDRDYIRLQEWLHKYGLHKEAYRPELLKAILAMLQEMAERKG